MEEICKTNKERLDIHGREIDKIEICLERLTVLCENSEKKQEDHEKRLREIENHSGEKWDKAITAAISALVAGLVAYFMTKIGM